MNTLRDSPSISWDFSILFGRRPDEIPPLVAYMSSPENDRTAQILRLNTQRENIVFALLMSNCRMSKQWRFERSSRRLRINWFCLRA